MNQGPPSTTNARQVAQGPAAPHAPAKPAPTPLSPQGPWSQYGMSGDQFASQFTKPAPKPINPFGAQAIAYYKALGSQAPTTSAALDPQYIAAFQGALSAARGHINNQLATALADIGSNEQAANQSFGQLPGQINEAYGQSTGTVNNALAQMTAAQKKSGMTPLMDVSAFTAPEMAAVNQSRNYQLQDVPMLQQGAQQEFARQRAGANMQAQDQQSALAMKEADMQMQVGLSRANQNHDIELERMREAASNAQFGQQSLLSAAADARNRKNQVEDRNFAAKQGESRDRMAAAGPAPQDPYSSDYYDWLLKANPGQAHAIDAKYGRILSASDFGKNWDSNLSGAKSLGDYLKEHFGGDPNAMAYFRNKMGEKLDKRPGE